MRIVGQEQIADVLGVAPKTIVEWQDMQTFLTSSSESEQGAWVNATANFGIAGGAALGGALLPTIGLGGLPFVGAAGGNPAPGPVVLGQLAYPQPVLGLSVDGAAKSRAGQTHLIVQLI